MNYQICSSITGESLIDSIELPEDRVESASEDSTEGHFGAGLFEELVDAGIDEMQSVYAIVR